MADNISSYAKFTGHPTNLSSLLVSREELTQVKGAPQKGGLDSSPIPNGVQEALGLLGLLPNGSDSSRIGSPSQPAANPYEGMPPASQLSSKAIQKLSGELMKHLQNTVQEVKDDNIKNLMLDSMGRVQGMLALSQRLTKMSLDVTTRAMSSRGA